MRRETIIGKGQSGNSAVKVFEIAGDHSISQNSTCYWIGYAYLGLRLVVFKDTPQGQTLTQMIRDKAKPEEIFEYIEDLAIRHSTTDQIKDAVLSAMQSEFCRGQKDKLREIHEVLGLYRD